MKGLLGKPKSYLLQSLALRILPLNRNKMCSPLSRGSTKLFGVKLFALFFVILCSYRFDSQIFMGGALSISVHWWLSIGLPSMREFKSFSIQHLPI